MCDQYDDPTFDPVDPTTPEQRAKDAADWDTYIDNWTPPVTSWREPLMDYVPKDLGQQILDTGSGWGWGLFLLAVGVVGGLVVAGLLR